MSSAKRARIAFSPKSVDDLEAIRTWWLQTLNSPDSANLKIEGILDSIDDLSLFPEIGTPVSYATGIDCEYRYIICEKYLAFCHYADATVFVDRIVHTGADYVSVLGL